MTADEVKLVMRAAQQLGWTAVKIISVDGEWLAAAFDFKFYDEFGLLCCITNGGRLFIQPSRILAIWPY